MEWGPKSRQEQEGWVRQIYGEESQRSWSFEASHRWAYRHYVGVIPDGAMVLHRCDNRACVRPDHLFLGSNQDNVNDMIAKGRHGGPLGEKHPRAKLTCEDIATIRKLYAEERVSQKQIAAKFGVDPSSISRIVRGKQWVRASAAYCRAAPNPDLRRTPS